VWELQGWPEGEWGGLAAARGKNKTAGTSNAWLAGAPSKRSRGNSPGSIQPEVLAQLGTPLLEVFVENDEQQQQQQQWSSQAVLLQPASSDAADDAAALAARDIGLEAELGELFREEVSRAVWGRSGVGGDAAAAAAASLANGRRRSSSSSSRSNTGKERLQPLLRSARAAAEAAAAAAAAGDVSSPLSPFAAAAAGASYESLFSDVAAAAAASQDEGSDGVGAFAAAAAVGGDAADADAAAAAAAAVAAASELEPWEEVLNAAEPALAAAAAAADAAGGVACADGVTRLMQRHSGSTAAAQLQLPTLQLLLEVVDGSSSALLAARAVSAADAAGTKTHGTAWVVADMPPGPAFVADWAAVPAADVDARQARLAASLEAQRLVRDMLGAKEGWWMTEFMGSWSPPSTAAATTSNQQQQGAGDLSDVDWQLPLHLLQQQQEWQERQQQLTPEQLREQQLGDMTLLEETVEEEDDSWPVLGDAASREGFYAEFYHDYGPGVQGPAGFAQPSASAAADAGGSSAGAAVHGLGLGSGLGLPADLAPAELDEALKTLAELKVGYKVCV
jgi:hypothetical protein